MDQVCNLDWSTHDRLEYYQWYIQCCVIAENYVHQFDRKRKAGALITAMIKNKKRKYKKKKYWVAPIFQLRNLSGFYEAVFPTLQLEDLRFQNYLRMSASQLENLLQLVGADIYKQHTVREPIETVQRLVLTLRFLASGDSIMSMSYQYLIGVTTSANIIYEVCEAIWNNLHAAVLSNNFTEEKWRKISDEFEEKWNFPHCLGAIDGKHVIIQCPRNAGSTYYNYKGTHSIVILAMCTASYVCTLVDIGSYGRRSDGGIYGESTFGKKFESNSMRVPPASKIGDDGPVLPYCIVGDEAFPLKPFLLRPYPGRNVTSQERRVYNYRLSRARRTIENTFGIIASRWRIFRKPILCNPDHVIKITQSTVCLHNWLRLQDLENESGATYVNPELVDRCDIEGHDFIPGSWRSSNDGMALQDIHRTGNNSSTREAFKIREKFCNYVNNEGSLGWQYDHL